MNGAEGITFLPWEGPDYRRGERLLVLGESHYVSGDKWTQELTRSIARAYQRGEKHRFFTILARTIGGRHLTHKGCRNLWRSLALYNFIQRPVGKGPRAVPQRSMWLEARAPFLLALESTQPRLILVASKRVWRNLPSGHRDLKLIRRNGKEWPARIYMVGADPVLATYIHHPSGPGFSFARWREIVALLREAPSITGA